MKIFKIVYLNILLLIFLGCSKEGPDGTSITSIVPLAPTELKATVVSNQPQIDLTWKDNSTNETGYKIERKTDLAVFTEIGSTGADVTVFSDKTVSINTNYTYRVYSFNQVGKSINYSNEVSIKPITVPTLTTVAISGITAFEAKSGGSISTDGGSAITDRGLVWGTSSNPTIALSTKTSNGTGEGSFSSSINGLTPNTTYYVRAYAINSAGTAYGNELLLQTSGSGTVAGGNGQGSAANQFKTAFGVFVDASGNIYVADANNHRIQKWAPGATSGTTVAGVGVNGQGAAANQLSTPTGVFVDGSGNIYVADQGNHRIQKWAPGATSGTTVAGGNGQGAAANQLSLPFALFVDASGNIYVADWQNNRIQKWAPGATSGTTVAGGNGQGTAANQLVAPTGVFVDGSGNIYVVDNLVRIQKWAPGATSGTTVAGGNGGGAAANQLSNPKGVFLDASGNIYVADTGNARIQKWAPGATSGTTVAGGNGTGEAANQLNAPTAVFVDASGNIYVVDQGNHRIQKWTKP